VSKNLTTGGFAMATDEERKAEKARRMLEKALRVPLNDTILQVQNGTIDVTALFAKIEEKIKEGVNNG
jgi:ABC-type phosphate/phosphonate transport system substrate-binding protein